MEKVDIDKALDKTLADLESQWPSQLSDEGPIERAAPPAEEEEEEIEEEEEEHEEELAPAFDEDLVDDEAEFIDEEERPKGYKTYEEWIAEGRDPKNFKGENAYTEDFERMTQLRSDVKDVKKSMKDVVVGMDAWRDEQRASIRSELETELAEAKEEGDVDTALTVQQQIHDLDENTTSSPPEQHPHIVEFLAKNPIIDKNSQRFNPEFYADMASYQTNLVRDLSPNGDGLGLSDRQVAKSMAVAFAKAKLLNPELFKSPRITRQKKTPQAKKRAPVNEVNPHSKLKKVTINRNNPRDNDSVNGVYEAILKTSGKKAAERFAKNMTE